MAQRSKIPAAKPDEHGFKSLGLIMLEGGNQLLRIALCSMESPCPESFMSRCPVEGSQPMIKTEVQRLSFLNSRVS